MPQLHVWSESCQYGSTAAPVLPYWHTGILAAVSLYRSGVDDLLSLFHIKICRYSPPLIATPPVAPHAATFCSSPYVLECRNSFL